jgi:hypothetical protein
MTYICTPFYDVNNARIKILVPILLFMLTRVLTPLCSCEKCNGQGRIIKSTCPHCSGQKVTQGEELLTVVIEQGMPEDHSIVSCSGKTISTALLK